MDLQSVTTAALFSFPKTSSGFPHSQSGSLTQAHSIRNHSSLSTVLLNAAASALRVDRTTRGTFLLDHAMGATIAFWFSSIFGVVVKMRVP